MALRAFYALRAAHTAADDAAKSIMGFFLTMCLLLPVSNLVRGIVSEKEARIREGMKMMVRCPPCGAPVQCSCACTCACP